MESNNPIVVDCETSKTKKIKLKLVWTQETLMVFIDLCLSELRKGNRPGSHLNKIGWSNLEKNMFLKTGKAFDKKQLKNKWDNMKKEWKIYDLLMRLETGIGGTRFLLDASPEWWEEKIKEDKDFSKFCDTNLEIYELYYAPLFRDSVAVGEQTIAPSQFQNNRTLDNVEREDPIEGKGDSDEINKGDMEPLFPIFPQSSSSKRKKNKDVANSRSTKGKTSTFEEKLDVVMEDISSRSTQTFPQNRLGSSISDCMQIVISFPGFEEGTRKYAHALRVFVKKEHREAFMFPTTHEAKMEFLDLLMD